MTYFRESLETFGLKQASDRMCKGQPRSARRQRFGCEPLEPLHSSLLRKLPVLLAVGGLFAVVNDARAAPDFHRDIQPILENYCFDCHADGAHKGNVALDAFKTNPAMLSDHDLWLRVLKNLRAGLMPPQNKARPSDAEKQLITEWIKRVAFNLDPQDPDPGRVTLRRLNRVEYRNTIHDLLGVDFDTSEAFPPDDTGHGFDDIGDVLTLPPMLLEKYVMAANQIVTGAVPQVPLVARQHSIPGNHFLGGGTPHAYGSLSLSYYQPAVVSNKFNAEFSGQYQIKVALMVNEKYVDGVFDYNRCGLAFRVDGKKLLQEDYAWEGGKSYNYDFAVDWEKGPHTLSFELRPLTTNEPARTLSLQITAVTITGPTAKKYWVQPPNYTHYFPQKIPEDAPARRTYARELLTGFARRAFRHPPEDRTMDRLVDLAETVYTQPGKSFEAGVAEGMQAILCSPRFLFLTERTEPLAAGDVYPLVDEYSLASRLSYFLWSTMPDEELMRLAAAGQLRQNLSAQVARMMKDPRSEAFVNDFTGQWLRARDIETVPIDARSVLEREQSPDPDAVARRQRFHQLSDRPESSLSPDQVAELAGLRSTFHEDVVRRLRAELTPDLRQAMKLETEKTFDYVLRNDRCLLELIDADYTFLNGRLARHYGIMTVHGEDMQYVKLPPGSPRGGVLTEGTVLAVTSNPTRTSPVKRGLFILDSILGTPPPPPPPNIPPLESAVTSVSGRLPTLRETLAAHRENPLCSSCHNRMDPLGLALENFNALGGWRDEEFNEPIDASGKLMTGESFTNIIDLKHILVKNHSDEFYRTLTEKMLIYALGRGLEYYDVETTDQIVAKLEAAGGRPSALITGIVESAPFQRTRLPGEQNQTAESSLHAAAETTQSSTQ
jgi:hypothetical protein